MEKTSFFCISQQLMFDVIQWNMDGVFSSEKNEHHLYVFSIDLNITIPITQGLVLYIE